MGRRTRRYETQFLTCLLVHGPMPCDDAFNDVDYINYRDAVMVWWYDSHKGAPPQRRSQWKFWKRYRTWYKVRDRRVSSDD